MYRFTKNCHYGNYTITRLEWNVLCTKIDENEIMYNLKNRLIMTLVRKNRDMFPSFSSLFDEFFNNELSNWRRSNYSSTSTTLPRVNVRESEKEFSVEMAAPGMDKNDFNIQLDQNLLTISSEKQDMRKEDNDNYLCREFCYQAFSRSFTIPESADGEKIAAKYNDGILSISIPKKTERASKKTKTINIS